MNNESCLSGRSYRKLKLKKKFHFVLSQKLQSATAGFTDRQENKNQRIEKHLFPKCANMVKGQTFLDVIENCNKNN